MNNSKTQRLIEKSIDGTINHKERQILFNRISQDKSANNDLTLRSELESIVDEREYFLLKQKLQIAYHNTLEYDINISEAKGSHINVRKYLYYAAAFTGIAMGGWVTSSLLKSKVDPTSLYVNNFKPYPAFQVDRSSGQLSSDSMFFRAMIAYKNGDYRSANEDFKDILKIQPNALTSRFYLGVTYMELREFEHARTNLMIVAESNSLFKEQALWYCGLSYLGELNLDDASTILLNLSKYDSPYGQKANELLEKLLDK